MFGLNVNTIGWFGSSGGGGGGTITGGGTLNYVAKFTGATAIGNSLIFDDGTSVGIGTNTPDPSALLDITSTTQGVALPRMTTLQRNAIAAPVTSLLIFNTSTNLYNYWDGAAWVVIEAGAVTSEWELDGNSNGAVKYIGTNDNFDLPFYTNGAEVARLTAIGNLQLNNFITDLSALKSIDSNNRQLFDTAELISLDWSLRTVYNQDPGGVGITDVWGFANVNNSFRIQTNQFAPEGAATGSVGDLYVTNDKINGGSLWIKRFNNVSTTLWERFLTTGDIGSIGWALDGNTNGVLKYIGTNDAFDFPIYTNGVEVARFTDVGGYFGIGTSTPLAKLHVFDSTSGLIVGNSSGGAFANTAGFGLGSTYGVIGFKNGLDVNSTATWLWDIREDAGAGLVQFWNSGTIYASMSAKAGAGASRILLKTDDGLDNFSVNALSGLLIQKHDSNFGLNAGSARVHIMGSTSDITAFGLKVQNSTSFVSLQVRNDGSVYNLGGGSITTNTAFGVASFLNNITGFDNSAFGSNSLSSNTTGDSNNAFGNVALFSNTMGIQNNAFGKQSLFSNISGSRNTGLGHRTLFSNTTGNDNVAIGYFSQLDTTIAITNVSVGNETLHFNTGDGNTAIGHYAMGSKTSGDYNSAIGVSSLQNSLGSYNSTIGPFTLYDATSGNYNTAIGYNTARGIITGSNNTIIGSQVSGLAAGLSDNIILATGAGVIRFHTISSGSTGIGTSTPGGWLHIKGVDATTLVNQRLEPVTNVIQDTIGATVPTTNATVTALQTIAIPTGSGYLIESYITAKKTAGVGVGTIGDVNAYVRTVKVKNVAGVVTIGTIQTSFTSEDVGGFNATFAVSGTNIVVNVTGALSDDVTWNVITRIYKIS